MNAKYTKSTITTLLFILLVSAIFITACGGKEAPPLTVPEGAQAGDLVDLMSCTYEAKKVEYAADCGTLVVPENRSNLKSASFSRVSTP